MSRVLRVAVGCGLALAVIGCTPGVGDRQERELEQLARQLETTEVARNPPLAAQVAAKTTYPSSVDPYFRSRTDPQVRITYQALSAQQVAAIRADLTGRGWTQDQEHGGTTSFVMRDEALCLIGLVSAATAQTPPALVVTVDRSGSRCP